MLRRRCGSVAVPRALIWWEQGSSRNAEQLHRGSVTVARTALRSCSTGTPDLPVLDTSIRRPEAPRSPFHPPRNPMEVLHHVFQQHPSALRLHRALTIALAAGNAPEAADLAATLAETVKRAQADARAHAEEKVVTVESSSPVDAMPPVSGDDIDAAVDVTQRAVLHGQAKETGGDPTVGSKSTAATPVGDSDHPFWRSSESLCMTLVESAFETEVPEGEDADPHGLSKQSDAALAHEQQQMQVLDEYLSREGARWKAQKDAIAKVILDVAREVGLTPLDLHAAEQSTEARPLRRDIDGNNQRLNVLRHANVVVRGEVPSAAVLLPRCGETDEKMEATSSAPRPLHAELTRKIEEELDVLKRRMATHMKKALTPEEEMMARYELLLANTTMRYVVGLHRDVQVALNESQAVTEYRLKNVPSKQPIGEGDVSTESNAAFFIQRVMEALHQSPSMPASGSAGAEADRAATLAQPVLPFTFMLKCCLWFAVPPKG